MTPFNTKKKLTDYYFIERIFDRATYRLAHRLTNGRMMVWVEKPRKKKIYTVGILSKYEANMCWVKLERGTYFL